MLTVHSAMSMVVRYMQLSFAFSEGKSSAKSYDCKYIEVSAAIDHQIDELLVGILKQIRLLRAQHLRPFPGDRKRSGEPRADRKSSDPKARFDVLRLLRRNKPKSCKNLYVLWAVSCKNLYVIESRDVQGTLRDRERRRARTSTW